MEERAIRERWPIPDKVRGKIVQRLVNIIDEDFIPPDGVPKPGYREVIAASRALLSADKLNLEQAKLDLIVPPDPPPSAAEVVQEMKAAAEAYERDQAAAEGGAAGGDRGGVGEVPDGSGPVQRDDPGEGQA